MRQTEGSRGLAALLRPQMKQAELARVLKVSPQTVSDWLRGDSQPKPELMAKIEDLLGVPMRSWTVELSEDEAANDKSAEAP